MEMASTRIPALRNLVSCQLRSLRASNQRRWAQVHDVRFLATTQASRSVLEKYREKLDRKAREEGHAGIEDLKKAYADKIHEIRKKDAAIPGIPPLEKPQATTPPTTDAIRAGNNPPHAPLGPLTPESAAAHHGTGTPPPSKYPSKSGVKPLDQILDVAKARTLPVPELTAVWRLRHAGGEGTLCAVVPQHTYEAMEAAARAHPQFVLPLPHAGQGAEVHFLQWAFDAPTRTSSVLFTRLAEYKARGEYALPHTTVTHHLDLVADKAVVLMQGSVVPGRGVSAEDARWLVMCLQRFYGGWDGDKNDALGRERAEERRKLLEWFGKGDDRFSVEKLLEEAERLP